MNVSVGNRKRKSRNSQRTGSVNCQSEDVSCRHHPRVKQIQMSGQAEGRSNVASVGHVAPQNKRPVGPIYPTVSPETVVVPIISCILGFPLLALLVICCLRRRAKLAREQARRRNCDIEHGTFSIVRFSSIHYLGRSTRAVSLRSERAMSRGFPSLELDTVVEERSDAEPEATVIEMMTPDGDSDR